MTTAVISNNRRKRALSTAQKKDVDLQTSYENSIRDDDVQNFLQLFDSSGVLQASALALRWAAQSKNSTFLDKIKEKMQASDLRQLITICQTFGHVDTGATETQAAEIGATAKKAKILENENSAPAKTKVAQNAIEKLLDSWPFQTARVTWNDNYKTKPSEKPLTVAESEAKWNQLVQMANAFAALSGPQKLPTATATTASQQDQLFERLETKARLEKNVKPDADDVLESKFINCRQTARMVFSRILFVEKMVFVVLTRDAAAVDKGTKLNFSQLLKKYSIPIPPASSFHGKAANFANLFQQHINTTTFHQQDNFVSAIEYVDNFDQIEQQ